MISTVRPVRKRYQGAVVTELACRVISGLGGPSVALGPLRVGEWMRERVLGSMRERVLGLSAVWPSVSGRMAFGLSPRGVASFVHARLGCRGNQGSMVSKLPSPGPHTCS